MSGFGPKATDLAARIGDAYTTTQPDQELLGRFRDKAKPGATAQAGLKVAWADTKEKGVDYAHRIWPNAGLPGELSQVLPTVEHFEQASTLVTKEQIAKDTPGRAGRRRPRRGLPALPRGWLRRDLRRQHGPGVCRDAPGLRPRRAAGPPVGGLIRLESEDLVQARHGPARVSPR